MIFGIKLLHRIPFIISLPKQKILKSKFMKRILILLSFCLLVFAGYGQENVYSFNIIKEVPSTPVRDQGPTSTCWSFSGISFLESELLRKGKQQIDLSEMHIVHEAYRRKAEEYVSRSGGCSFSPGGQYYDFLTISRENGLVPEKIYPGLNYGSRTHNHDEMDAALKGYVNGVLRSRKNTTAWKNGFTGILDAYLGEPVTGFLHEGKWYSPTTFSEDLGIDFDDYIVVSSFNDHPYYKESVLEVPGNWAPCTYYNVPLEELVQIIDNALMNGYSVAWASDMRGKGFSMKRGVAIVPENEWSEIPSDRMEDLFSRPHPQKKITEHIRQREFQDHPITGDHGMHIVGIAEDQEGNIFYKVKNSWGPQGKFRGYIYVSREFVMLKTTNILINRNSLPLTVAGRLGMPLNNLNDNTMASSNNPDEGSGKPADQPASISLPATQ